MRARKHDRGRPHEFLETHVFPLGDAREALFDLEWRRIGKLPLKIAEAAVLPLTVSAFETNVSIGTGLW